MAERDALQISALIRDVSIKLLAEFIMTEFVTRMSMGSSAYNWDIFMPFLLLPA